MFPFGSFVVSNLCVHADHRRNGSKHTCEESVATLLMDHIVMEINKRQKKVEPVYLMVCTKDVNASEPQLRNLARQRVRALIRMYEHLKFHIVAHEEGAVVMANDPKLKKETSDQVMKSIFRSYDSPIL